MAGPNKYYDSVTVETLLTANGPLDLANSSAIQDAGVDVIQFDGSQNVTLPNGDLTVEPETQLEGVLVRGFDTSNNTKQGAVNFGDLFNTPVARIVGGRGSTFDDGFIAIETAFADVFSEGLRITENQNVDIPNGDLSIGGNSLLDVRSSSTALAAGDLSNGEIAMDEPNGRLVWKDASGSAYYVNGTSL